jgi:hypothetical protein
MPLRDTTMDENVRGVGYAVGWRVGLEEIGVSW